MTKISFTLRILLGLVLTMAQTLASASASEERPDYLNIPVLEDYLHAGLTVEVGSDRYFGITIPHTVFPSLHARYGRWFVDGRKAGFNWFDWENTRYEIFFNFDEEDVNLSDSNSSSASLYEGLRSRHSALEIALSLTYFGKYLDSSLALFRDISDKYDSIRARAGIDRRFGRINDDLVYNIGLFINYKSEDYTRYYYGISEQQARVGRPAYKPGNTAEFGVATKIEYRISDNLLLDLNLDYIYLDDAVTDSPLVQNHYRLNTVSTLKYIFK